MLGGREPRDELVPLDRGIDPYWPNEAVDLAEPDGRTAGVAHALEAAPLGMAARDGLVATGPRAGAPPHSCPGGLLPGR